MTKYTEEQVLLIEREMEHVEVHPFAGGKVACFSRRCPAKESGNEDAAALIPTPNGGVLVVADGAGGARGGAQASSTTIYEMVAALENAESKSSIREAILDGLESANREVCTLAIGAATTAAVAEIHDGFVRPYHAGDSGILLAGQKGKLKLQSVAHSPVGYAVESGLLGEDEALFHEDRHLVSNVIGIPEMRIEIGSAVELSSRDTLLLASDGLFDNLMPAEIIEILRTGSLEESAQDLVDVATRRMLILEDKRPSKPDDLTILVFRPE